MNCIKSKAIKKVYLYKKLTFLFVSFGKGWLNATLCTTASLHGEIIGTPETQAETL